MEAQSYLAQLHLPSPNSHKGQNGKLLIIGGSELFHAASKWSLDIASHFVDMVFYASVPSNNELVQVAKGAFWNGIVIDRSHLLPYLHEADVILIGPGMERTAATKQEVDTLLAQAPAKKWVIDAGALQMVDPTLIPAESIITPHAQEWSSLAERMVSAGLVTSTDAARGWLVDRGVTILLKGQRDEIWSGELHQTVIGGNPGMTKGGTGDVLAGLVAGLYCTNPAKIAAIVGSYVNKKTGEWLANQQGPFFNATELAQAIPTVLWQELQDLSV